MEESVKVKSEGKVKGEIRIADDVVAVIVALAAQEVEGVVMMTGGIGNTILAYVGMSSSDKAVKVEVSDGVVSCSLVISVKYGCSIPEVCANVQNRVRESIETMTGLKVSEVNVRVVGID